MTNELHSHTGVIRDPWESRLESRGQPFVQRYTGTHAVGCGENLGFTRVLLCMRVAPPLKRKSLLVTVLYCESRIDN